MGIELLGWIGTISSLIFYIFLAAKKVKVAYVALAISCIIWGVIGICLDLSSLLCKEILVLIVLLIGWKNWSEG